MPPGGSALTVAFVDSDEEEREHVAVVPTEYQLRSLAEDSNWVDLEPAGFEALGFDVTPLKGLVRTGELFNYPAEQVFTAHRGELFMLARAPDMRNVRLLTSGNGGELWREIDLPDVSDTRLPGPMVDGRPRSAAVRAIEPLRLRNSGGVLYLVHSRHIWRLTDNEGDRSWEELDLEGLPLGDDADADAEFPAVIRNYLPESNMRPFEMMTVLREQLMIYRRTDPTQPWILTSTAATVDRDLVGTPISDTVFMVAPDSIWRTDDQGEQWFPFWPEEQGSVESVLTVRLPDVDKGYVLLAGTSDGAIWRSTSGGADWASALPPDPDARGITGLAWRPGTPEILASTMGRGVLRSGDFGESWKPHNQGFRSARPLDVGVTSRNDLMVATGAGAFRLSGDVETGNWLELHNRGTSTIHVSPETDALVSGTFSGDVTLRTTGEETADIGNPFEEEDVIFVEPSRLQDIELGPSAVVIMTSHGEPGNLVAWARMHGAAQTNDAGVAWRPFPMSEALNAALGDARIIQFLGGSAETFYLLEVSRSRGGAARLWRSRDGGDGWSAVHAFDGTDDGRTLSLAVATLGDDDDLFAVQGGALWRSRDAGERWTEVPGPWESLSIAALSIDSNRAVLLVDSPQHYELMVIRNLGAEPLEADRHILTWPDGQKPMERVRNFVVRNDRIYIGTEHRLFVGRLPDSSQPIPYSVTIFITAGILLLATGLAFVLLRGFSK